MHWLEGKGFGGSPMRDWGYTAGLLHDIGKLVLNQFVERDAQAEVMREIETVAAVR